MSAKPKSTNTCAPGAKKYLEKILSKSRKLWTTKLTVVFFIKPNAPSVSDDIDVMPDNTFTLNQMNYDWMMMQALFPTIDMTRANGDFMSLNPVYPSDGSSPIISVDVSST